MNKDTSPVRTGNVSTPDPGSSDEKSPATPGLSDPEQWVELHGDYLFRYAMTRLRDASKAEDAVQETFLAALKGGKSFAGRSAEKSWLTGILKNKIADYYRKASRESSFTDLGFYMDEESDRFVADGLLKDRWLHDAGPAELAKPRGRSGQRGVLAGLSQLLQQAARKRGNGIQPAGG